MVAHRYRGELADVRMSSTEQTPVEVRRILSLVADNSRTIRLQSDQRVFRFETFGDEQLWTDKLRLHEVVEKNVADLVEYLKSL